MSRHELTARDPAHKVIVGWDHPLLTFFVQVIDRAKEDAGDDDKDDKFVLWRGTRPMEIYEIDQLGRIVGRYAEFTPEIGSTLYGDKDEGR
jgi:hypothetical protein